MGLEVFGVWLLSIRDLHGLGFADCRDGLLLGYVGGCGMLHLVGYGWVWVFVLWGGICLSVADSSRLVV